MKIGQLYRNYGGFSQTSSMPLIDNYQNELETKPVYCKVCFCFRVHSYICLLD